MSPGELIFEIKLKVEPMKELKISSFFVWLGILLASLLSSCNIETNQTKSTLFEEKREVEPFTRIEMDGGYQVIIEQGDTNSLIVITPEANQDRIRVWNQGEILRIKTDMNNVSTVEAKLLIKVKKLEYLKIRGGVNLENKGQLHLENFEIDVEGGANIDMYLEANVFKANSKGGVNMMFKGQTNEFHATSEGAGNIDAIKLEAKYVHCRVAGVGNASVYPTEKLDATVEGVGKIGYRGSPEVNKNVNGIGLVYRK